VKELLRLKIIKSEGLAHNSYYISDNSEAAIIDPRRDSHIYITIAKNDCAKITDILETHRNEDYVIGSLELQNQTDAEISHSNKLSFKYGEKNLADGDTLNVGKIKIKILSTPGHTDESLCYLLYPPTSPEPTMIFTGDTLFAGSVGRTDLYGKDTQPKQAEKLYCSLHEKILPLGDGVLVYPAHGTGSICGSRISQQEPTTIGYEKKTNPYLQLSKEEFLRKTANQELMVPRYFKKMEELNQNGPPLLAELTFPRSLSLEAFEEHMQESNMTVVDTRKPYAFNGSHIPGALSIWLKGTTIYPGWLMDTSQYIIFIHERDSDINRAAVHFRRLGFDNICGYLCGGINVWQEAGKPISTVGTVSVFELKEKLERQEILVLDVREPSEWKQGIIEGAKNLFFADLAEKVDLLPKDKPIAAICTVGNRTSIATSILKQKGFKKIHNVLGGMSAWSSLGYATTINKEIFPNTQR
jgi:hydroxyacylglutathione hydrolase